VTHRKSKLLIAKITIKVFCSKVEDEAGSVTKVEQIPIINSRKT
jgi:hypothetical protein